MKIRPLLASSLILLFPLVSHAQFDVDGAKVCIASGTQGSPRIIPDGTGGAILCWEDFRSAPAVTDIYAQRINAAGVALWANDGVAVCTASGSQLAPYIVSDGAGSALIAWMDQRSGTFQVYAQKINANGVTQWTANGVQLAPNAGLQSIGGMVSDGQMGAIVLWIDQRADGGDLYAQRVTGGGIPMWAPATGAPVVVAAQSQSSTWVTSDGAGGMIVVFDDIRNGNSDIFAQRIASNGAVQWAAGGASICVFSNIQRAMTITSDGAGGAIMAWNDSRNGVDVDLYAQRINTTGTVQWTANGVAVSSTTGDQYYPALLPDGVSGCFVAWLDTRSSPNYDIYSQHLGSTGVAQWTGNGLAICAQPQFQDTIGLAPDGAGGVIMLWRDLRAEAGDIYAQRVTSQGTIQWTADGSKLTSGTWAQSPAAVAADGFGGVLIGVSDLRATVDVFAQRVDATYGYWGHPEPVVSAVADIRNDQGGKVKVNWTASGRDRITPATIDFYSVWRAVDVSPLSTPGAGTSMTTLDRVTEDTALGTLTQIPASSYYWELAGTQTAFRFPAYSFAAETRADSVLGNAGDTRFMVAAHALTDQHIAFASNVLVGHSVDNLAPAAPLALTAQRLGGNVNLKWNRVRVPDLRNYAVYRKSSAGVTPIQPNFLDSAEDTVLVDPLAPNTALYYIVTAYDVHANQGPASNEAGVSATTGVGGTPGTYALSLSAYPNPFNPRTTIRYTLPFRGDVSMRIYDAAGNLAATLIDRKQHNSGDYSIEWDGHTANGAVVGSGVYFARIEHSSGVKTHKITLLK